MEKNYYDILGINTEANEEEIKSAFRKLARKCHPDVTGNTPDSVEKFKSISEAYDVLSDQIKRRRYDALRGILHRVKEEQTPPSSKKTSKNTRQKSSTSDKSQEKNTEQTQYRNPSDADSRAFFNMWDSLIHKSDSNSKKQEQYTAKKIEGTDITSDITISIEESLSGTTRTVNILHTEPCSKCHGRKFVNGNACTVCKGNGETSVHKKLTVKIPENVKHNSKIRIAQEGNQGANGGKNGDLYLIIKIENNSTFKYDGLNVLQTMHLEPYEAVLGCTVSVKTSNGQVSMRVMPKTVNGQKYRLAKQGLAKDNKIGDMIVTISIEVPKDLSEEEIILYEKLKLASHRNIRENIYGK